MTHLYIYLDSKIKMDEESYRDPLCLIQNTLFLPKDSDIRDPLYRVTHDVQVMLQLLTQEILQCTGRSGSLESNRRSTGLTLIQLRILQLEFIKLLDLVKIIFYVYEHINANHIPKIYGRV